MLTHEQIWSALDALAKKNSLSVSGLARNAGLDPTSFNKSKRYTNAGRERWPSTESVAKVLKATQTSVSDFFDLLDLHKDRGRGHIPSYRQSPMINSVPLIGFAEAGVGGFFDDGGFPAGQGWDEISLPASAGETNYALKVSGDSMLPLYRNGDIIIVDPAAQIKIGDRVVVKTREGEVMAKLLENHTTKKISLKSLNPEHEDRSFDSNELEWIARIIWASQ